MSATRDKCKLAFVVDSRETTHLNPSMEILFK